MIEPADDEIRMLLRSAVPPMGTRESPRDLWPEVLQRIDRAPTRFAWFDWVLAGLAAAAFVAFPEVIPFIAWYC